MFWGEPHFPLPLQTADTGVQTVRIMTVVTRPEQKDTKTMP